MTARAANDRVSLHVLLVEDDEDDFLLTRKLLEECEWQALDCVRAADLNAAFEFIGLQPPDVVLLDLSLPNSDGLETYRRMHARLPDAPIILLTGRDDEAAGVESVKEGAQDYIVKGHV
ncbi:MAG: response regulator, partial [Lentisphaerae bacterium]|nr:response regulator [Lentisphaerota bacterium]